jgi:hypothetical protein
MMQRSRCAVDGEWAGEVETICRDVVLNAPGPCINAEAVRRQERYVTGVGIEKFAFAHPIALLDLYASDARPTRYYLYAYAL